MEQKEFIKENWGIRPLPEIVEILEMSLSDVLEIVVDLELYQKETPNVGRRWTPEEERFLTDHAKQLSIREVSNVLNRSYYATYQKVRLLGLGDLMIKKK